MINRKIRLPQIATSPSDHTYADFNGRASRKEYWMFYLFNFIFAMVAMILDNILRINFDGIFYKPLYYLYGLSVLVPGLSVTVRRLHDLNKSGCMFFIVLIPIAIFIWLLVLLCTEGDQGENQYGPNPKREKEFIAQT